MAATMYREMGMASWRERAERALSGVGHVGLLERR
jgi:hypothetical protein